MVKQTHNIQSQPKPTVPEAVIAAVQEAGKSRKSRNLFAMAQAGVSERTKLKSALLGDIRQKLAEIADTEADGLEKTSEASEKANQQAFRLYQARATGVINADELSGLLGDVFGFKLTSKGVPGKTPNGAGETIRKRIVNAVAAVDYAEGRDGGAFFDVLDREDVKDKLHQLNEGTISLWQFYKDLSDMKSQATNRPHMAFDPRKIAAIVDKLAEEGAGEKVRSNTGLVIAYGKLIEMLNTIGEVPAEEAGEVEEELVEELTDIGNNPVSQAA